MITLLTSSPTDARLGTTSPRAGTSTGELPRSAAAGGPRTYLIPLVTILAIAVAVGAAILLWPRGGALTADPVDAAEAGILVDLTAKPAHLMPGEPTHLTYQLTDAATGQPVGDLASNRGRAFRVLMISTDLSDLRPITAHESAPGVFHVLFTPSVDTHYVAYALFSRDGLQLQDLRHLVSHSGRIVLPNLRTVVEGKVVGALGVGLLLSAAFQPSK